MILETLFQHHPKALNMILNEPKYCAIIEVYFNKFMNKIFESNYYYSGKNNKSIIESKWHYRVLVATPLHCKGCLMSIFLCDYDLMVAREAISE